MNNLRWSISLLWMILKKFPSEAYLVKCDYGTDVETESDDDQSSDKYNFNELELIKMLKSKKVKILKINHNCEDAFKNPRAFISTLAQYFKSKLQNNPQYKLKDIRKDLKDQFNLNASTSKLKRAKKMDLQKLQGCFLDNFNRIEAYANELRLSNSGSDIVINLSKDALEQGKRKFLKMYICFNALKLG
ncbi:hypothetical protein H5410_055369 [Solanum commersonii]|uniref:Uncharacterized protein n=1 Tax=Solanum commersonii TaxID=4109 RepID=A0A9J5WHD9_SOLCO|nr:hypothetical protein H5410_055369 [Solanum commersonii]